MPRPSKGPRLGGGPAHERLLLANLATALITHRSITTTETKAKRLRPLAERLVTFAKRGDLHARRRVLTVVRDKTAVHELFTEIAPLVADRPGGYTRITKTGYRKGDNAPMAVIELILDPVTPKATPARSSRRGAASDAAPAAAAAPAAETADEVVTDEENAVDEAQGGADDTAAVEATEVTETSEPVAEETETPAAAEVEADAAEVAEGDSK